jgi:hypothetical protein
MTKPNNSGYRFIEKDPVIDLYREARRKSGMSAAQVYESGGATVTTQRGWDYGNVKRPQHITLRFSMAAMGFTEQWVNGDGTVLKSSYRQSAAPGRKGKRK